MNKLIKTLFIFISSIILALLSVEIFLNVYRVLVGGDFFGCILQKPPPGIVWIQPPCPYIAIKVMILYASLLALSIVYYFTIKKILRRIFKW